MTQVFVSVGTNFAPEKNLNAGVNSLRAYFGALTLSSVYESEAVGGHDVEGQSEHFLNMVIMLETELTISEVVRLFKQIERENGRISSEKSASVPLDLDLLLYGEQITIAPIPLPRADILSHAFVLRPLAEIAPELKHPVLAVSYQQLWQDFDQNSQKLWPIAFNWSNTVGL